MKKYEKTTKSLTAIFFAFAVISMGLSAPSASAAHHHAERVFIH
jgi:hypothetical protein